MKKHQNLKIGMPKKMQEWVARTRRFYGWITSMRHYMACANPSIGQINEILQKLQKISNTKDDMLPFADAGNEQVIIVVGRHSSMGLEMDGRAREQLLTNGVLAPRQLLPRVIRFLNSVNIDTTGMRELHVMLIGDASRPVPLQITVDLANPDIRTFVRLMAAIRAADALNQHPPKQITIVLRGCSGFSVAGQVWTRWWHMHKRLNIWLIVCNDLHPLNNVYAASTHLVHFEGTKAFGIYDLNGLMRQHAITSSRSDV
jgi:hypothetical protein